MPLKNNGPGGCCCGANDCCAIWPDTLNAAANIWTDNDPFGLGGTWVSTEIFQFPLNRVSEFVHEGQQATGSLGLRVTAQCRNDSTVPWLVTMYRLDNGVGYGTFQTGPREFQGKLHISGATPSTSWTLHLPMIISSGDINAKPNAHSEQVPCTPAGYSYVLECEYATDITFSTAGGSRTVEALATEYSSSTGPHVFMYWAQGTWTSAGDTGNLFPDFVPPVPNAADFTTKQATIGVWWDRIGGFYRARMVQSSTYSGVTWSWYISFALFTGAQSGSPGCSGNVTVPLYRRRTGLSEVQIGDFQISHTPKPI